MNKWLFKIHRWTALLAALPLIVICATGSAVVFKYELDELMDAARVSVPVRPSGRLDIDQLFSIVDAQVPTHEIVGWQWFDESQRADVVYVIPHGSSEWHYITVDPYSGAKLSAVQTLDSSLTDWLLDLHFTLLMGDIGMMVSGLVGVLLCTSGITGLILHRKFWTTVPRIRWRARTVLSFSDFHKVTGALAAPVLLVLGFTGAWWNIEHGSEELSEHWAGATHHVVAGDQYNKSLSMADIIATAEAEITGFEATYIRFPWEPDIPIAVFGRVPTGNPLASDYSSYLTFDIDNGSVLSRHDIRDANVLTQFEDSFRELHFGTFGGMFSRILWFLVGIAPLALAATGLWLWQYRHQKARTVARKRMLQTNQQALLN